MTYYKLNSSRLTFGELWRISKLGFPLLALLKVLRIPLPQRLGIPYPCQLVRLDESELDLDGRRARLGGEISSLEQAGLRFRFPYRVANLSPDSTGIGLAFLNAEGWVFGTILEAVSRVGTRTLRTRQVGLVTRLSDGTFLTTGSKGQLANPPEFLGEVVRGGPQRISRRHLERIQQSIHSPQAIDGDRLEDFVRELEDRTAKFHIERGAWVEMSARQVAQLQGHNPTNRVWQFARNVMIWVGVFLVSFVWSIGGIGSCSDWDEEQSLEEIWSGEEQFVELCETGFSDSEGSEWSPAPVVTFAALFGSPEEAEASKNLPLPEGLSETGRMQRLGNALFYRMPVENLEQARPLHDAWLEVAESVSVVGRDVKWQSLQFALSWQPSTPSDEAIVTSLDDFLGLYFEHPLRPPWPTSVQGSADQPITEEEANARRTYRAIQEAELLEVDASWGWLSTLKGLWEVATFDEENWKQQFEENRAEQLARVRESADRLIAEDPTLDPEVLRLYVEGQEAQWQVFSGDDVDPFAVSSEEPESQLSEEISRQLQQLLGAPAEPAVEASAEFGFDLMTVIPGWLVQTEEEVGMRLSLWDPAAETTDILRWICSGGVDEITVELSDDRW